MAAQEVLGESPEEPINPNFKKWIFRVSIHCEGCKKKVKKLLTKVPGVHEIDVDIRQHKVTVIGDVDAATLLRKLTKSGKQAELWPENPIPTEKKKPAKPPRKVKEIAQPQPQPQQESPATVSSVKEAKPVKLDVVQAPALPSETQESGGATLKVVGDGDVASQNLNNEVAPPELSKSEGKKPEEVAAAPSKEEKGGESSENATATVSDVVGKVGDGNDGASVKKKKSRGQKGNTSNSGKLNEQQQSSAAAENGGPRNLTDSQQNPSMPDHLYRPRAPPMYDHHYYGPPPVAAPQYATMSYNTAYPSSSYTASYYAPAPPNSYVHSYTGAPPEFHQAPPPGYDPYPARQPLESFEMFSDENPNGCLIM